MLACLVALASAVPVPGGHDGGHEWVLHRKISWSFLNILDFSPENTTLDPSRSQSTPSTNTTTRRCQNTKSSKLKRSLKLKFHTQSRCQWRSHTQSSSNKKFTLFQSTNIQFTRQNMFITKATDMEAVMVVTMEVMVNIENFPTSEITQHTEACHRWKTMKLYAEFMHK